HWTERLFIRGSVVPIQVTQEGLVGIEARCGIGEEEAIDSVNGPRSGMDGGVVGRVDGGGVWFVGVVAAEPVFDVVDIGQYCRRGAAWDLASTVAGQDCTSLGWREESFGALLV